MSPGMMPEKLLAVVSPWRGGRGRGGEQKIAVPLQCQSAAVLKVFSRFVILQQFVQCRELEHEQMDPCSCVGIFTHPRV